MKETWLPITPLALYGRTVVLTDAEGYTWKLKNIVKIEEVE